MKFRNQSNGYEQTVSVPWLWASLFGGFYFIAHGAWTVLLIWFILTVILYAAMGAPATILVIIMNIAMAVMAGGIIRRSYLRKGWEEITADTASQANQSPGERPCPFCAEPIKRAAIKCKHCGSDVALQEPTPIPVSEEDLVMQRHGITFERGMYRRNGIGYDSLQTAIDEAKG